MESYSFVRLKLWLEERLVPMPGRLYYPGVRAFELPELFALFKNQHRSVEQHRRIAQLLNELVDSVREQGRPALAADLCTIAIRTLGDEYAMAQSVVDATKGLLQEFSV